MGLVSLRNIIAALPSISPVLSPLLMINIASASKSTVSDSRNHLSTSPASPRLLHINRLTHLLCLLGGVFWRKALNYQSRNGLYDNVMCYSKDSAYWKMIIITFPFFEYSFMDSTLNFWSDFRGCAYRSGSWVSWSGSSAIRFGMYTWVGTLIWRVTKAGEKDEAFERMTTVELYWQWCRTGGSFRQKSIRCRTCLFDNSRDIKPTN